MPRHAHPLRGQFEEALVAHINEHGDAFNKALLVKQYVDLGVGESTVWRWIADILRTGRVSRRPGTAAKPRAVVAPPPSRPEADEPVIVAPTPRVPRADDAKIQGLLPVLELLREAVKAAQDVIRHARNSDGTVRNARLIQSGAENLRRAVETAAKLNETVAMAEEMRGFHRIVLEEIAGEAPALQERILIRLRKACVMVLADS